MKGNNKMKQPLHRKTKVINKILVSLGLVFVLGSAVTQVHGADAVSSQEEKIPVITIHSTDNVTRGKTGSFVLNMSLHGCLVELT